jgi:hypothetical protein
LSALGRQHFGDEHKTERLYPHRQALKEVQWTMAA